MKNSSANKKQKKSKTQEDTNFSDDKSPEKITLYQLLNVEKTATKDEIVK